MSERVRVALAVAAVALVCGAGLSACGSEDDTGSVRAAGTETPFGPCRPLPPEGEPLDWLPDDLPLPDGTFAVADETTSPDYLQGVLVSPLGYRELNSFVVREWPAAGFILGPGETEVGEIENTFVKDTFFGQIRARDTFCDAGSSEVTLLYFEVVDDGETPATPPPLTTIPG